MKKEENKKNKKNDEVEISFKFNKKKLVQGLGIALVVVAVLGLAFAVSNTTSKDTKAFEFVDITVDDYLEKMKESEKSVIYVARPGCSWCQKESPIIKALGAQYDLTIYYLNTDPFWDSENETYTEAGQKFMASAEQYKDGWGTPNTIIVQNGEIVDGEFSYVEKSALKDLFKRNGFING
ncbi:MAG: hypothetical protein IJ068_04655 [Bacilli bacterium]|nr:hypothetical protein [Bacilli bacterium]